MSTPPPQPLVYFVLGTPGSGRREIIRDLVENGLAEGERALVLVPHTDAPNAAEATLATLTHAEIRRWSWQPPELPSVALSNAAVVFFLSDATADPITQLEALKPWLEQHGAQLARVFCVVDCQLAEKQSALRPWFEACIHFADVVFLARRAGVDNKWMSDFIGHFKKESFPCHFIQLKKGDLPNPALVLDPTPRRITQYFDEGESYAGVAITKEDGEEAEEGDDEFVIPEDPYFVRNTADRREKELPDISHYLPAPE